MKRILMVVLLISILSLMACSNSYNMDTVDGKKDLVEVNIQDRELLTRSEDISDLVVELYGIDDATTIVFNQEAYIAIKMGYGQQSTEYLKDTIIHQVKEKDPLIEEVYISTDPKIFKEIDDVIFNLLQGQSYDRQVKKINKIGEKIKK
ncbi:MAG: hypothetical protein GX185_07665 [Tissierellia bacterium]|nr:hypothetical protein [Tissierellia bacterium]